VGLLSSEENRLFGFIIATKLPPDGYNIVTIDVDPGFRRRGIGTELLKVMKGILQNNEIRMLSLQVSVDNTPAIDFYQKHGFTIVKTLARYYPTTDGYQMEHGI
jgi:ribosomal-protein-alanine N-acetyltransferase